MKSFEQTGFMTLASNVSEQLRTDLKNSVFTEGMAGKRCLLENNAVAETARILRRHLIDLGHLPSTALAIQAIAFDKTPTTNWKVPWHQDLMFPMAKAANSPGYLLPTLKDGVHFAQPPQNILTELLAARLHLDSCHANNGPLRVSPGTHHLGIIPSNSIMNQVEAHGQIDCLAAESEVLLMRPLLLHASSQAVESNRRRILHFVFHSGAPVTEAWAQTISNP